MLYNKHVVAAIYVFNGTKCLLKLKKTDHINAISRGLK